MTVKTMDAGDLVIARLEVVAKSAAMPTCEDFLACVNMRSRARTMGVSDWECLCECFDEAVDAAAKSEPYYREWNAGGVANSYGYNATTARCGVFSTPCGKVMLRFNRTAARKGGAACIFNGGEKSYAKWFRETREES